MFLKVKFAVLLSVLVFGVLIGQQKTSAKTECEKGWDACLKAISDCSLANAGTPEAKEYCNNQMLEETAKCDALQAECESSSVSPSDKAAVGGSFKDIGTKLGNVKSGFYGDVAPKTFEETVGGYIKAGLALVGVIFLMLMVYGGYTWMIARGDETEAKKAEDTITMAAIGMAVVLIAYVITYFILSYALESAGLGI